MNTATDIKSNRETFPVSRLDLMRARLSHRILGLTVKASGRTRIHKMVSVMGKHDNLRNSAYKIYHAKISHALAMAQAEVLQKIHTHYEPKSEEVQAAEPKPRKATVNLNFNLENFSSRFMTGVNEAAEDSFQVISRGLLSELGEGEEVTPQGVITKFINKRENKVVGCPEEIYKSINSELEAGTQAGDTMDELAKRIQDKFEDISKGRAMVIAQTETQSVYGTAQANAIKQAGFEKKQWVSYHDDKVRDSHEECNDQGAIPVDEAFANGLMYPGDPSGPADEVIGCRCYLIAVGDPDEEDGLEARLVEVESMVVRAGDVPGHEFHGNQYTELAGTARVATEKATSLSKDAVSRKSHRIAHEAHRVAALAHLDAGAKAESLDAKSYHIKMATIHMDFMKHEKSSIKMDQKIARQERKEEV